MPSSRPSTQDVEKTAKEAYGFVPNLVKEISDHNPAAARLYLATMTLLEEGTLTDPEREIVLFTVSRHNDCHYCTSAHGKLAVAAGLSPDTVRAVNSGDLPSDDRLRVLVQATRLMLDKRGWLDAEDLESLERKGVDRAELYEINALIGIKTFSNYVNHVAQTDVDAQLQMN